MKKTLQNHILTISYFVKSLHKHTILVVVDLNCLATVLKMYHQNFPLSFPFRKKHQELVQYFFFLIFRQQVCICICASTSPTSIIGQRKLVVRSVFILSVFHPSPTMANVLSRRTIGPQFFRTCNIKNVNDHRSMIHTPVCVAVLD